LPDQASDGEQREWKTISGEIDGEPIHSASWDHKAADNKLSDMGQMMSELMGNLGMEMGPEEQKQMQAMESLFSNSPAMQDMMGKNGSMADTMQQLFGGGGGAEPITLNITGHDPGSRNILTEHVLSIHVDLERDPKAKSVSVPDAPVAANIAYYQEHSGKAMPEVFYVSAGTDPAPTVTFDTLELDEEGGEASGSFEASLCRLKSDQLTQGPDLSTCMPVTGTFETTLVPTPQPSG